MVRQSGARERSVERSVERRKRALIGTSGEDKERKRGEGAERRGARRATEASDDKYAAAKIVRQSGAREHRAARRAEEASDIARTWQSRVFHRRRRGRGPD